MTASSAPIEAGIGQIWLGKQSALGTMKPMADTNWIVPRLKAGELGPNVVNGSEEYVDGQRWASPAIFRDTAGGLVGTVSYQGQVETVGQAWAWQFGSDTVTGGSDPYTHTIDTNGTAVCYLTAHKKVGANVGPVREDYIDSRASKTVWTSSQSQNVVQIDVDLVTITPAQASLVDPTQVAATPDPINWTSVSGQVVLNGVTLPEVSGETVTADLGVTGYWGDSVTPAALIEGKNSPTRVMDTIVTANTLKQVYAAIYGTQTPTGGTQVSSTPTFASMSTKYAYGANRDVTITTPRVELDPSSFKISPSPTGGTLALSFGGNCLKSGATAAVSVVVRNGDSASYIV
jgi:hypothetical protein